MTNIKHINKRGNLLNIMTVQTQFQFVTENWRMQQLSQCFYTRPLDETQRLQMNGICPLFLLTVLLIILPNSLVFHGSRDFCLLSMQIWCSGRFLPFARQSQVLTGGGECFGCRSKWSNEPTEFNKNIVTQSETLLHNTDYKGFTAGSALPAQQVSSAGRYETDRCSRTSTGRTMIVYWAIF